MGSVFHIVGPAMVKEHLLNVEYVRGMLLFTLLPFYVAKCLQLTVSGESIDLVLLQDVHRKSLQMFSPPNL